MPTIIGMLPVIVQHYDCEYGDDMEGIFYYARVWLMINMLHICDKNTSKSTNNNKYDKNLQGYRKLGTYVYLFK